MVGEGFFHNLIFVSTAWPTPDQISQGEPAAAQELFHPHIQSVNWATGPSPRNALDIIRMATECLPRQVAIQRDLINCPLPLEETNVGRLILGNLESLQDELFSGTGNQRVERIREKLREFHIETIPHPSANKDAKERVEAELKSMPNQGSAPASGPPTVVPAPVFTQVAPSPPQRPTIKQTTPPSQGLPGSKPTLTPSPRPTASSILLAKPGPQLASKLRAAPVPKPSATPVSKSQITPAKSSPARPLPRPPAQPTSRLGPTAAPATAPVPKPALAPPPKISQHGVSGPVSKPPTHTLTTPQNSQPVFP
ncbi:hypothetical protein FRC06_000318 [Ceratobasidium sp. 370]|nr:hypothetical protein FRC06_000318 [Ceratobasidium sp. 370]